MIFEFHKMNLLDLPRDILLHVFTSMPLVYFTDATTVCKKINELFQYYISNPNLSKSVKSSRILHLYVIAILQKKPEIKNSAIEIINKNPSHDKYYFECLILDSMYNVQIHTMEQYKLALRCLDIKSPKIAKFAGFHDLPYKHTDLVAYKHGRMKAGRPVVVTEDLLKYAVKYDYKLPYLNESTYAYAVFYDKKKLINAHNTKHKNTFIINHNSFVVSCNNMLIAVKYLIKKNRFDDAGDFIACSPVNLSLKYRFKLVHGLEGKKYTPYMFQNIFSYAFILRCI